VALTRLGDQEGEDRATKMLESGIPDVQLMAAGAFATRGDGSWVTAIMPLLQDPNGLTRFMAAELIAPIRPEAAAEVAIKALADQNPNIRSHAARLFAIPALAALAKQEIPRLRAFLRDYDPVVRLEGAALIVDLTGAPY
jgi:HEAT repeat protein